MSMTNEKKCIDCGASEIYADGIYCNSCNRFVGRSNEKTCVLTDSTEKEPSMTEREARGFLDKLHQKILHDRFAEICTENDILALVESKNAWTELEQYRAIGTVSEFRELKEKATPKKPIPFDKYGECHECPTCGYGAENHLGCGYKCCPNCGTEFDWSEGKE